MKKFLAVFIFLTGLSFYGLSQQVDNTNYYQYQNESGSLNWLRSSDAIPTIIDELKKNGIAYHTISVGNLIKINDSTRLVVTVSFDKGGKKYGFLYEPTHGLPLNPKDRDFLKDRSKACYTETERDLNNKANFMRISPLPRNIFLLKQTCYWFQFDDNNSKYPVTKDVAQSILRQDIRDYLKTL